MEFLELVNRRYSCRKYASKPVGREVLERCLEAARLAPSACNAQGWHFIIVHNQETRTRVTEAAFSGVYSMNSFAKSAGVLVVVVSAQSSASTKIGGYCMGIQYSLIDIGIACEHFMLQATYEGLGSCMLGWFNQGRVKKMLFLPKNKKIEAIIILGYPHSEHISFKKRKPSIQVGEFC